MFKKKAFRKDSQDELEGRVQRVSCQTAISSSHSKVRKISKRDPENKTERLFEMFYCTERTLENWDIV